MKRIITIEITSISEEAINWATDCLEENLRVNIEWRKKDTNDPDIEGEITNINTFG